MASVQCAVTKGDHPMDITWFFQNKPIDLESNDYTISKSGKRAVTLTIESVTAKHVGEYTCVAENRAGSRTRSAILEVNGIPQQFLLFIYILLFTISIFPQKIFFFDEQGQTM